MNKQSATYGVLCGALLFAVLSWAAPRRVAGAADLAAPANGRFEIARVQGDNGVTQGVFLLDTETGCVWNNTPIPLSTKIRPTGRNSASYLMEGGDASFSVLAFDTAKFVPAVMAKGKVDFSKPIRELQREERLCDQARVRALEAAAR